MPNLCLDRSPLIKSYFVAQTEEQLMTAWLKVWSTNQQRGVKFPSTHFKSVYSFCVKQNVMKTKIIIWKNNNFFMFMRRIKFDIKTCFFSVLKTKARKPITNQFVYADTVHGPRTHPLIAQSQINDSSMEFRIHSELLQKFVLVSCFELPKQTQK